MRWAVLALLALGCGTQPTEAVVSITAPAVVQARSMSLEITVFGAPERSAPFTQVFQRTLRNPDWPVRVTLAPLADDPSRMFRIRATARDGAGGARVGAELTSSYRAGESIQWTLSLDETCLGVDCVAGQTCDAGACADSFVPLDGQDGGGLRDAAISPDDAGRNDAGDDAGRNDAGDDAGRNDAGPPRDAGFDAAVRDSGGPDAGCDPIPGIATAERGDVCDADGARVEGGAAAGLGMDAAVATMIDGHDVSSCIELRFATPVSGDLQLRVRSVESACGSPGCVVCNGSQAISFFESLDGAAWRFIGFFSASRTWTDIMTRFSSGGTAQRLLLCRAAGPGASADHDDVEVDWARAMCP